MRSQVLSSERTPSWVLPAALCVLAAIPVAAGVARVVGLSGLASRTAENARFFADPVPVVVHVVGATAFALLGAFQFWSAGRARFPRWHRWAGRVAVLGGLASAASGVYMAHFYTLPADDGPALYVMRLVFGPAMLLCVLLGAWSARRRAFAVHRVWMLRAYAIGMGAGTQALLHLPWLLLFGKPDVDARAVLMGAGWVLNLLVVELRKG